MHCPGQSNPGSPSSAATQGRPRRLACAVGRASPAHRAHSPDKARLTPPFSPEIIPISLGHDDLCVLAVVINTDYIRRPVMINQGNRVLVRLDDQNQAPDWYRLRDLFTEQAPSNLDLSLPPADPAIITRQGQYPDTDLALRGRLLLTGPHGRPSQITGTARAQALATLTSNDTPLPAQAQPSPPSCTRWSATRSTRARGS